MLKNYIMTAWKVFLRRKFFTFINLFGIGMTMAVIVVFSTIAESGLYPSGPEKTSTNYLTVNRLTITNDKQSNTYSGRLGFKFIKDNIFRLQAPELISINSGGYSVALYQNNTKFEKTFMRTDANFFRILDFDFIDGRPYTQEELDSGQFVAVINKRLQREFFPKGSAVGQTILVNNQAFKVIGVVNNVSRIERTASSDIWAPYTTFPSTSYQQQLNGSWSALLYHSDPNMLSEIKEEYVNLLKNDLVLQSDRGMTQAFGNAMTNLEVISYTLFGEQYSYDTKVGVLLLVIGLLLLLFMLLPSINMINLNVSRIMERSTEIGVRKAFGASVWQLVAQFIIESILLTLIGGIFGFALGLLFLDVIESSGVLAYAEFGLNLRVIIWGLFIVVLFGIISGVYPAIKMSRLHPVSALKGAA